MNAAYRPSTRRAFAKSWGAEFVREGEVLFRLWAPGAESLSLRLAGADTPMARNDEGWFEILATGVERNAPYSFVLPDGTCVPDPASRAQLDDVHGASLAIDPTSFGWRNAGWAGRPWEEAVIYELHVGAFTSEGTFRAAGEKLPYLAGLGVTAVELMPVAHFSGSRGWGYDGVLPYAPHPAYGRPDDLKALVDAAHGYGLMVLLDVVYNHFGPEGNYLPGYAPDFFHRDRHTPWGAAIAYERQPVRQFFIENALYWLEEYNLDGLRLDAIDNVRDEGSDTEILIELAERVRAGILDRHIHLATEDNRNVTHLHERGDGGNIIRYTAEWNDDFHNAAHVIATGETDGYYEDFAGDPAGRLARILAEGFAYQGDPSPHWGGKPRGEPSRHLPPTAFIDFLQNHDQVGNRALGERLPVLSREATLQALSAIMLLSPHIPLLFMGEEWGETRPFYFFTDFDGDLADAVRDGRRREFAKFGAFSTDETLARIPDPNSHATFQASKIDWERQQTHEGRERLAYMKRLLELRQTRIAPLLKGARGNSGHIIPADDGVVAVDWTLAGGRLQMRANLTKEERSAPTCNGEVVHTLPEAAGVDMREGRLPAFSVVVAIERDAP